ncbi:multidrug resistance protein [Citrobacter freundii]|nr:multidrug resistance protein [Citrobacter freundii]
MLLRSALGMAIVMLLMGLAQNIWQFLVLRALLGLLGGFIPNANALIATQVPRNKSGWALGTLSHRWRQRRTTRTVGRRTARGSVRSTPGIFHHPPAYCWSVLS